MYQKERGNTLWDGQQYIKLSCYNKKTNTYFALVCRIHFERDSYYNFSYNDMDESENPYFYNCPKRIMDIIERSKPVNDMSKEWRMKVHKVLDTKLTKRKSHLF